VLEGERGRVLAGVPAGVVDADGRAGNDLLGENEVVGGERLRPRVPGEHGDPERGAAGAHRDDHHGVKLVPDHVGGLR
jgi:hypothetical protein